MLDSHCLGSRYCSSGLSPNRYIQAGKLLGVVNVGVWLILVFLLLNMLGNLASGVSFENLIAAPITIILALCAFRLAIEK
jgi:hypothetical protein